MRTFFYMGRNSRNISGVSWKIWRIEQKGRRVTTAWGAAILKNRKPVLVGNGQTASWTYGSERAAHREAQRRIAGKLAKGYECRPRVSATEHDRGSAGRSSDR